MRKAKSGSPNGRGRHYQDNSARRIDLMADAEEIKSIFRRAVQNELSVHKRLGNPIATWKDGKVVIIPPEDIPVEDPTGE